MNKTYRTLSLIVLSSTLIVSATENVQQDTPQTTTSVQHAWQNKWVKVGMISTACAIVYAVGVRLNIVPAPSLRTLSLVALPVIGKKAIDANTPSSDNQKNDTTAITTTNNSQETITVEPVTTSQDEQSTETKNEKKITLPSINDIREITDTVKNWLLDGVHSYTPKYEENYQ